VSDAPSTVELLVRLVFSLGLIIGLVLLAARVARRSGGKLKLPGFGTLGRRPAAIEVLDRQSLTRSASLAVIQVGTRTMVVGITEHGVSLLAEGADLAPVEGTTEPAGARSVALELTELPTPGGDTPETIDLVGSPPGDRSPREAEGTAPPGSGPAVVLTTTGSGRPPRMSLVEALRELTVRKT
jgi:flagellar protein FliO/FliZ